MERFLFSDFFNHALLGSFVILFASALRLATNAMADYLKYERGGGGSRTATHKANCFVAMEPPMVQNPIPGQSHYAWSPGALPRQTARLSNTPLEWVICHSDINRNNYFARKNYFYPDLPKGYS
jgi:hypothetical protein